MSSAALASISIPPLLRYVKQQIVICVPIPVEIKALPLPPNLASLLKTLIDLNSKAIPYALLLACISFQQEKNDTHYLLWETRARAAEVLAIRVLWSFADSWRDLVEALTFDFSPRQGRPDPMAGHTSGFLPLTQKLPDFEVNSDLDSDYASTSDALLPVDDYMDITDDDRMSTLEIAILAHAVHFTSDSLVVRVVTAIWQGDITFYSQVIDMSNETTHITSWGGAVNLRAPTRPKLSRDLWQVSKLRIARYQHITNMIMYALFVWVYYQLTRHQSDWWLGAFLIFMMGFAVESFVKWYKSGWQFYSQHLLSVADVLCQGVFWVFITVHFMEHDSDSNLAEGILACASVILYPRILMFLQPLVGFGVYFLVIKTVMWRIFLLTGGCVVLGFGFWQAFYLLLGGDKMDVALWLLRTSLGDVAGGFNRSHGHPAGPALMILYVLFMTLLPMAFAVSLVWNSVATMGESQALESQFQFTLQVMEQAKSEALYPVPVPFNLLSGCISMVETVGLVHEERTSRVRRFLSRVVCCWMLIGIFMWERFVERRSVGTPLVMRRKRRNTLVPEVQVYSL